MVELWGERRLRVRSLIEPASVLSGLGPDRPARETANRRIFDAALAGLLVAEIRQYLQQQKLLATVRFRAWVESRTGCFVTVRSRGRQPQRSNCP